MMLSCNKIFILGVIICALSVFICDGNAVERISRKKCQEYGNLIKSKTCIESSGNEGPAKFQEYPHMAMIGYSDKKKNLTWSCSGVLISHEYILTNAHCVNNKNPAVIRLGELNIESDEDNMHIQDIKVSEVIKHPAYSGTLYNDIALIKLEKPVEFNEYIRAACLPDGTEQININQKFIKSGWGLLARPTQKPDLLFNNNVPNVSYKKCKEEYEHSQITGLKNGIDENSHICTGTTEYVCEIISGSPIQLKDNDVKCMYKIFGLLSFAAYKSSFECALDKPEVSTKISTYIDWIEKNVWP